MGNGEIVDSMINDGLWCAFEQCHMGNAGEVVAEHYHVGRAAQDAYAARSHQKAAPRDSLRAGSRTRSCRCPFRRERATRWSSTGDEAIRPDTTVGVARGAEAGVQEGRHASPPATRRASTTAHRRSS